MRTFHQGDPDSARELADWRRWRTSPEPLVWGGMIIRPTAPIFLREELEQQSLGCGIYLFRYDDGSPSYLGRSVDVGRRLRQHFKKIRGQCRISFRETPEYALNDVEIAHIHALEPYANSKYEPRDWIGHEAMAGAIRKLWNIKVK